MHAGVPPSDFWFAAAAAPAVAATNVVVVVVCIKLLISFWFRPIIISHSRSIALVLYFILFFNELHGFQMDAVLKTLLSYRHSKYKCCAYKIQTKKYDHNKKKRQNMDVPVSVNPKRKWFSSANSCHTHAHTHIYSCKRNKNCVI